MTVPQAEPREHRLKRLHMRSMRRGMKEMDLILSRFAEAYLGQLDEPTLELYDAMLSENDQDLYAWVVGQTAPPETYAPLIAQIADHAGA